ncbi:PilZ domain-containing protein [Leptolyngbya sp. 15MV]|nr:PilZ domain-containing protein [Leptolyngbya sp. 15MV]
MSGVETRAISRDSLLMMAGVRFFGCDTEYRVKVRNLSAGGMMAEGDVRVERGMRLEINLRNIGWIEACVAWLHGDRWGAAFTNEIDPALARANINASGDITTPRHVRPSSLLPEHAQTDHRRLRPI